METDFAQTKSSKFPTRPQKHPLSAWDLRWLPKPKTPTQNLKNRQSALPRVVLLNTHFARTHAWLYLYFGLVLWGNFENFDFFILKTSKNDQISAPDTNFWTPCTLRIQSLQNLTRRHRYPTYSVVWTRERHERVGDGSVGAQFGGFVQLLWKEVHNENSVDVGGSNDQ